MLCVTVLTGLKWEFIYYILCLFLYLSVSVQSQSLKPCETQKKNITRQLHDFKGKFETVAQMKAQVIRELRDELPKYPTVDVGYFEGRQSSKIWLVSDKDLESMYHKAKNGSEIFIWVQNNENDSDDPEPEKKKKKPSESSSRRQDKEEEVEVIFSELKSKHDNSYTVPQLKLWARMIHCGTHEDYEDPPHVPMITGMPPKCPKKDSLTEALTGAAEAVAKAFAPPPQALPVSLSNPVSTSSGGIGISPGKSADLRMKNLHQLRFIQQLYEENILSETELTEQKANILAALRKLA